MMVLSLSPRPLQMLTRRPTHTGWREGSYGTGLVLGNILTAGWPVYSSYTGPIRAPVMSCRLLSLYKRWAHEGIYIPPHIAPGITPTQVPPVLSLSEEMLGVVLDLQRFGAWGCFAARARA